MLSCVHLVLKFSTTMSEIFVYDNNPSKLTDSEITKLIKSIAPKSPYNFVNTGKGIIFKFYKDIDANFIFTPHATRCFEKKNLNVSLSLHAQRERNIYISDPPEQLIKYTEREFISDIWARYNESISSFKTFKSAKTSRNYFIITPCSNLHTKNILEAGKIILFNLELPVQAMRGSTHSSSTNQRTPLQSLPHDHNRVYNSSQGSALPVHSRWGRQELTQAPAQLGQAQGPPATHNGVTQHLTTSRSNALYTDQPPSSIPKCDPSAQHPHSNQNIAAASSTYSTHTGAASPPVTQHGTGPIQGHQLPSSTHNPYQSDKSTKLHSFNLINLTERLSQGIDDNPEDFVILYNQILQDNGMATIIITPHVIAYS